VLAWLDVSQSTTNIILVAVGVLGALSWFIPKKKKAASPDSMAAK
jgi:LPXTG-motif cell wall-anchored protein